MIYIEPFFFHFVEIYEIISVNFMKIEINSQYMSIIDVMAHKNIEK
jgi:hypothetical protein